MFGYPVGELVGQSIDMLVPSRLRPEHEGLRRGFLRRPTKRPMGVGRDLNGTRKDGSEFPVEIGLTPIDGGEGAIVLATIVDITERRKAELELAEHARGLERANEQLTQFAYVASHDLQEPLRKIAVYAGPPRRGGQDRRRRRRRRARPPSSRPPSPAPAGWSTIS